MICFPNAKINLGLQVVEKRPDGFHNLQTVFYPIGLCDALELIPADSYQLHISGINVACEDENNLVTKAFRLMEKKYGIAPVEIWMRKAIPFGAGLGGGSADAAFTLKALDSLFHLNLGEEKLCEEAANLGSDCPFFIGDRPVYATGRGEIFHPCRLSLKDWYLVLVIPPIAVSTAEAYRGIRPQWPASTPSDIVGRPVKEWSNILVNDFETSIFAAHPAIASVKEELYRQGAAYASMSGSGSSVFGLFEKETDLSGRFPDCFYWAGHLE